MAGSVWQGQRAVTLGLGAWRLELPSRHGRLKQPARHVQVVA
jgi:hypothetical protein